MGTVLILTFRKEKLGGIYNGIEVIIISVVTLADVIVFTHHNVHKYNWKYIYQCKDVE